MAEGSLILPHTAKIEMEEEDEVGDGSLIVPHSESDWSQKLQKKVYLRSKFGLWRQFLLRKKSLFTKFFIEFKKNKSLPRSYIRTVLLYSHHQYRSRISQC